MTPLKRWVLAGGLGGFLALGTVGVHAEPMDSPLVPDGESPKLQTRTIQGTFTAFDNLKDKIRIVSQAGAEMTFDIDGTTPISDHNLQLGPQDLHPGDRLEVTFERQTGYVQRIERL